MRRLMIELKNMVLIVVTVLAALGFIIGGCMLDSDSWIPFIMCGVCGTWLALFGLANGGMER